MSRQRLVQLTPPNRDSHHGEDTAPFTVSRRTDVRVPRLECEQQFSALFVLDAEVPVEVSRIRF